MRQAPLPDSHNLRAMELFKGLSAEEIARIHAAMQYRRYRKGDFLLTQGQSSGVVFFLHEGLVKICWDTPDAVVGFVRGRRPLVVNLGLYGMMLGEIHALDDEGHSASVVALENVGCFVLTTEQFRLLRRQIPGLQDNFDLHIGAMVRRQTAKICCFLRLDLPGKIAALLLHFAEKFGEADEDDHSHVVLTRPLANTLIGDMTGHRRESISRNIGAFEKRGWIAIRPDDHRIVILNAEALHKRCDYLTL